MNAVEFSRAGSNTPAGNTKRTSKGGERKSENRTSEAEGL